MSIDIEGLMAEVEKFRKRLAELGDELTLNSGENASDATKAPTLRQDAASSQPKAPDAAGASAEPESELAALVRSAFAHKVRRSRRN
jgi:hypothetical protein